MSMAAERGERSPREYVESVGGVGFLLGPVLSMCERMMCVDAWLDSDQAERMAFGLVASLIKSGGWRDADVVALQVAQARAAGRMDGDQFRSLSELAPMFVEELRAQTSLDAHAFGRVGRAGKIDSAQVDKALHALGRDRW